MPVVTAAVLGGVAVDATRPGQARGRRPIGQPPTTASRFAREHQRVSPPPTTARVVQLRTQHGKPHPNLCRWSR
jgi:hypothetical protein